MKRFGLMILFCFVLCLAANSYAEEISLHFFNAGKADACLIQTANSTVLIDTGKNKFGKELIAYMEENGISDIDVMFITHFDKDHVGGADKVLENIRVHRVIEPAYQSDSKQFVQYSEAVAASQAEVFTLDQNGWFELDGVSYNIDVANQSYYGEDEENDFSLVISIKYGETSFLFAGDAESPRLAELLAEGIGEYDVLKVPHHGKAEKLSDSFFAAVKPKYSIITSDEEEPEEVSVVKALEQYGKVFLTRLGNVRCTTDGNVITFGQE